jgi:hypothetical protein
MHIVALRSVTVAALVPAQPSIHAPQGFAISIPKSDGMMTAFTQDAVPWLRQEDAGWLVESPKKGMVKSYFPAQPIVATGQGWSLTMLPSVESGPVIKPVYEGFITQVYRVEDGYTEIEQISGIQTAGADGLARSTISLIPKVVD